MPYFDISCFNQNKNHLVAECYKVVYQNAYSFEPYDFENSYYRDLFLINELKYLVNFTFSNLSENGFTSRNNRLNDDSSLRDFEIELENIDLNDSNIKIILVDDLCDFKSIRKIGMNKMEIVEKMIPNGFQFTPNFKYLIHRIPNDENNRNYNSQYSDIENNDLNEISVPEFHKKEEETYWDIDYSTSRLPEFPISPKDQFQDANESKSNDLSASNIINTKRSCILEYVQSTSQVDINQINIFEKNDVFLSRFTGFNYNSADVINYELNIRPKYRRKRRELRKQKSVDFSQFDD
jgi:hypothetical protein